MPRKRNKKLSFFTKDNLASDILLKIFKGLTTKKKKRKADKKDKKSINRLTNIKSKTKKFAKKVGFFGGKKNIGKIAKVLDKKAKKRAEPDLSAKNEAAEKTSRNRRASGILAFIIIFLIVLSAAGAYFFTGFNYNDSGGKVAGVFEENLQNTSDTSANTGVVKGEKITDASTTDNGGNDEIFMKSQNFIMKQVHFGGDLAVISDTNDSGPLQISDVKSEVLIARNRDKEENKLVISWKTNRLATSIIQFGKSGDTNMTTIKEDSYGFTHNAILSGLAHGVAYNYVITVRDHWGNENEPGHFAAYSGAKSVSVFELIAKTLADLFGWAGANK